jgi:hypothetical protein
MKTNSYLIVAPEGKEKEFNEILDKAREIQTASKRSVKWKPIKQILFEWIQIGYKQSNKK